MFAKRYKGKFLLRIEDTDRKRSTPEAVDAILEGMEWLGMSADEPPIFQFERAARHVEVAEAMISAGKAFRCYVSSDELQARRDLGDKKRQLAKAEDISDVERDKLLAEAHELLKPFRSPYRNETGKSQSNGAYTVRLRAPDTGKLTIYDEVQGEITINSDEIDDLILLRADGTPTYMLAVVVDDHDMGVTHVIRGDDHLRNAFRQTPIYEAMGWNIPHWAHLPMIHGDDGAKLSKRHGALGVEAYKDMGFLPAGLCNYLMRLGWSWGDKELFTLDEASEVFELKDINKAPSRLDFEKMADINGHHMRACSNEQLYDHLYPLIANDDELSEIQQRRVLSALPILKERGNTLPELANAFEFLLQERPIALNKKARKALRGEGLDRLAKLRDVVSNLEVWSSNSIQKAISDHCERHALSMGQIGPPLRAALTGNLPAPDLNLVADWLGREETLARIDDQLANKQGEPEGTKG